MTNGLSTDATADLTTDATTPGDFEGFVATLPERDQRNLRRHVAACEAEPTADHADLWKRLASTLAALTGGPTKTTGTRAIQFFVADGPYRKQMFALEDPRDGTLIVYAPDVLAAATAADVIRGPIAAVADALAYEVAGVPGLHIDVEILSMSKTVDAPEYYRHLCGWGHSAIKITLPMSSGRAQVHACECICRLAARDALARMGPSPAPAARHG
jgi:hypothetical protein